jgi:hypothetical protein
MSQSDGLYSGGVSSIYGVITDDGNTFETKNKKTCIWGIVHGYRIVSKYTRARKARDGTYAGEEMYYLFEYTPEFASRHHETLVLGQPDPVDIHKFFSAEDTWRADLRFFIGGRQN